MINNLIIKNKIEKKKPELTLYNLTNSGYEIVITTYKKSRRNHKAQNPKT